MARDVIIVGAGPAGLAAAIWARTLHLDALVVEQAAEAGGQLHRVYNPVADYPGLSSPDGRALASRIREHAANLGVSVETAQQVVAIDAAAGRVTTTDGEHAARFVLLSTGIRPRTLGIPGEAELVGRGVSPSASRYAPDFAGKDVLVVGGGDAAFEEALILAKACRSVTLSHRSDRFTARPDFRQRVADASNITVVTGVSLLEIEGSDQVEGARIRTSTGDSVIPVQGVFICVGIVPNTELVRGQIELDDSGFVVTDAVQRTSCDRLYAAGDLCSRSSLTISAATGQGAAAIKDMQRRIARGAAPATPS